MISTMSMFCTAANGIRDSICEEVNAFLTAVGARRCAADTSNYEDLPLLASHEKHQFELSASQTGWMDLIHRDEKLLQFVINLRYPKKRWFPPRAREWKQLANEASNQFGKPHRMDMENKTCLHFQDQNYKLLLTSYDEGKHHFIEIKMAKGQFCY